jgi:ribulose-5-phosphate 4-epimerase/fuculose-1-phosphate aldolase
MASTVTAMLERTSAEGWQTRCDLAACYRLVDLFGWSDLIDTRITARVTGREDHFLINPHGLLFDEITASSLVKIDREGN